MRIARSWMASPAWRRSVAQSALAAAVVIAIVAVLQQLGA